MNDSSRNRTDFSIFETSDVRHVANGTAPGQAHLRVIREEDFSKAGREIRSWDNYQPTKLLHLQALARRLGIRSLAYKDESTRFGIGSFKALGAAYAAQRLLASELSAKLGLPVSLDDVRARTHASAASRITLVSASDGNHGRALAWASRRFGCRCVIYLHAKVSAGRQDAIESFGAKVVRVAGDYDESVRRAKGDAAEHEWSIVSDSSWSGYVDPPRDVMAGYGVMIEEAIAQSADSFTHVFLQCGVGGMAASVAAFLRQRYGRSSPRIVIVEPQLAACLFESAVSGRSTSVRLLSETVMAGLSCGVPSELAWQVLREEARDFLTIPDDLVAPTMNLLAHPADEDPPIAAGESAVAGLAALIAAACQPTLTQKLGLGGESRILVIGTEGPTDPEIYRSLVRGVPATD